MYLVQAGDRIIFSVKAEGAEKYEWQVNKEVQAKATGNSLAWTVPNKKAIWEIHLTATGGKEEAPRQGSGQAHQEWVVSTLNKSEAPDFFDYFTDFRHLKEQTEKDPWDRPMKKWNPHRGKYIITDTSMGFVRRVVTKGIRGGNEYPITTPLQISCGTWKFRYRFPHRNTGHFGFGFGMSGRTPRGNWNYGKCSDAHHHCRIGGRPECAFSFSYDGTGWSEDGKWHEVTVIRTKDKWLYMYNDYIFECYVNDKIDAPPERLGIIVEHNSKGHTAHIDCIEVYRDKYLFPQTSVHYGKYTWNYYVREGYFHPLTREGIVVKGRNVRLVDIARILNDPSRFTYDAAKKTAICKADLVIHDGANFIMENETLKFHCSSDGQRHFVLRYGADVKLSGSTITTTGSHYFVWNNAGSTTHYGRPILPGRKDPIEFNKAGLAGGVWPLGCAGVIRFTMDNSIVNNATHIFFDSPMELSITNSKFLNMRELDIGGYKGYTRKWGHHRERTFAKGDKSFWVYTDDINTNKFNFSNVSFSGKTSPINLTFLINAARDRLNVYNLNLEKENIVIKKSLPQVCNQSHTWDLYQAASFCMRSYGGRGTGMDSKLGLVNCKFKKLIVPTDRAWGIPKYYLDVKVVDKTGRPVRNAKVEIKNEVDDKDFPAENLDEKQQLFYPGIEWKKRNQYSYLSYHIIQGLAEPSTVTGADGHTSSPKDRKNTVILADIVQDKGGKKEFTYTITVEKDGRKKIINGVNPGSDWYRPDPNKPTYTITAVLDGKTATEAELKKKGLAGSVKGK